MDSQAHIVWCPAYAALKEGKYLECNKDLVEYYQEFMKIREDYPGVKGSKLIEIRKAYRRFLESTLT